MKLKKAFIYTLLGLSGSRTLRNLNWTRKFDISDESVIRDCCESKLKKLLLHAWENVPYYHDVLEESQVVSNGQVSLENFTGIPLLTKDIITQQGDRLYSRDYQKRKPYSNTSGGSTGQPVQFIQDKAYDEWNTSQKLYFNAILGKEPGDKELKLWGSDRDIIAGTLSLKDRIINCLYNRKFFNSYRFDKAALKELVELNNKFRPKAYWSYMESAMELAEYVAKNHIEFISPEILISTIGPLTEPVREKIEKALGCKVYNQYGSREVGVIGCECRQQDGLHCFPWFNHIELLDENEKEIKDGQGKVIVTTLENYSMPLIRFEIGDVAIAGGNDCACGRKTFKLKKVIGRTLGYFKRADGALLHSHFIVQMLFNRDWLKRFQIIQETPDRIVICLELKNQVKPNRDELDEISSKIKMLMGDSCAIEYVFVDHIQRSPSGKYLYTICKVE